MNILKQENYAIIQGLQHGQLIKLFKQNFKLNTFELDAFEKPNIHNIKTLKIIDAYTNLKDDLSLRQKNIVMRDVNYILDS